MQQTINEINSKISDIADVTTSDSTSNGVLLMDNINESEPIKIEVHPTGTNISHLIVGIKTIIGNNAILRSRTLRFTNLTTEEVFNYIIPDNLFYYDNENYDTFTLEYEGQICQVVKKCKLENGDVVLLDTPVTTNYPYPTIPLTTGDYRIELIGFSGYIFARLMCTNMYTEQFATKVEMTSAINQKANEINAGVTQTLTDYVTETQLNSVLNITENRINASVSEVNSKTVVAQSTANNAQSAASTAQTTADNATTLANTAQERADSAYTTATSASTSASQAVSTANTANNKADSATTTANAAQSIATSASNTANQASNLASAANTTANTASGNANEAKTWANEAKTTANNASSAASEAYNLADTANTSARLAQSTANTATTKADNAQSTANTANTKAENAQSTANTANTKADNAQTSANNAQTSANNAQTSADNALQDIQDTNNAITGINENIDDINSQIADLQQVTTTFTTKTELQQTADSFDASITQATETLTQTINGTQSEINEIKNYIHYDIQDTTGTLTLGKTDNPYTLQLTNHELKINENDNTVAYFDEDSMQVTNGVFNTSLAIGNFEFRPETNGSLSFTRRVS